jgi:hypothetical protein
MNITVRSTDNSKAISAAIRKLADRRVMVGVPAATAMRQAQPGQPAPKINNAELAYIHDHGAPEVNIPARPFLAPGIASVSDKIAAGLQKAGRAALAGDAAAVDRQLNRVGLMAQAAVRAKITDGPFVPLAPATILARLRRGRPGQLDPSIYGRGAIASDEHDAATGMRPLIDTGALRNAINYVIRTVKGIK